MRLLHIQLARVPECVFRFGVVEDVVCDPAEAFRIVVRNRPAPCQLIAEIQRPEYRIHQHSQVGVCVVVAVDVDAACRFEDAVAVDQSRRHERQVSGFILGCTRFDGRDYGMYARMIVLDRHLPIGVSIVVPVPDISHASDADAFVVLDTVLRR